MHTLRQLAAELAVLPTRTAWYLTELGEARGKQELFTRQSPQKLKLLREHALIESAVSSNRQLPAVRADAGVQGVRAARGAAQVSARREDSSC